MTSPAKVPHEGSNWRTIDIFVFTNGQQHSPPRKYHLSAQELNWWNNILSYLARSQYGSLNSIVDLYTVEGRKVDGPLELINGASYVAVKPPDHFIDTGYTKYLIKASKSWEKSQARRSNSVEILKPEGGSAWIAQSNLNIPVSNKNFKNEIVTGEIVITAVDPDKVIERPLCVNVHEYPQTDTSAVFKQTEKRRIYPTQRSSILRKSLPSSTTKKDSLKSKDVIKRNSKGPIKINDKVVGSNNIGNAIRSKIPLKIAVTNVPKSETDQKEDKDSTSALNYSNLLPDRTEHRNEKKDSLLVSNIYKCIDSEIPSMISTIIPSTCSNHISDISGNKLSNIAEECHTDEPNVPTDVRRTGTNIDLLRNNELDDHEAVNASQIQKAPNVCFKDKPDSNYVVISNGDIVNLKLQIEVRNGESAISKKAKPEHSSTDIGKIEKASQINVDNEMALQNKSLQSLYYSDFLGMHRNSALVIVKCPCCPENNSNMSKNNTEAHVDDNKMYVVLLPTPGLDKNFERCQYPDKVEGLDRDVAPIRGSIINPVKKTEATTALEILSNMVDLSQITMSSIANTEQNVIPPQNTQCGKIASEIKHRVAINENEVTAKKYEDIDCSETVCNENNLCTTSKNIADVVAKSKEYLDKSTQTELCSLLVEARLHEDGRYSFHLPPLDVLKYYKF